MKKLDLNLLPIALALYDELSVSRAARQLRMSQPAVSKALRRLRETFDDPLFIRGPSGMVPTPRAHAMVRAARPHLRHLQDDLLREERFIPSTSTQPIVLGLSDIAEMAFLPSILAHLRVHAPHCASAPSRPPMRRWLTASKPATWTSPPVIFRISRAETSANGASHGMDLRACCAPDIQKEPSVAHRAPRGRPHRHSPRGAQPGRARALH